MEEKKMMHKNQLLENCGRDFQASGDIARSVDHHQKVYGRDLLLQLRLHPLSLQKPKNIPEMEMVKENLYLHDIANTSALSNDKHVESSSYHAPLKSEYCAMKQDYQMLSHYLGRMYPYYFAPHLYDGSYSNSSKIRSSLHAYCSPLKKHAIPSSCYKHLDEYVWAKRCFATSEDMWNCYQNFSKKKENLEGVPKTRKKLPIIDPATGKNVLESVTNIHQKYQSGAISLPKNSETSENVPDIAVGAKHVKDFFHSETNGTNLRLSNDTYFKSAMSSSGNNACDKIKCSKNEGKADSLDKDLDNSLTTEEMFCSCKSVPTACSNKENLLNVTKAKTACEYDDIHVMKPANELDEHDAHIDWDSSKCFYNNANKTAETKETCYSDMRDSCQTQQNSSVNNNEMKEYFQQFKDKMLKEEQQKIYILQSFLHYKKYQLEETARNLDEKRINIVNWTCNLFKKAKKLHDKELWLESKSEMLYNKSMQLAEREKLLWKEETKSSGDDLCSDLLKEGDIFAKKPEFNVSTDVTWKEISENVKNSYKSGKSCDDTYFDDVSMNKVYANPSSSIEESKSDACSLEELEKNIGLIEKLDLCDEDGAKEKMREMALPGTMEKKEENDSLGYSKGRRYLPEHIKYWLNKRD